MAQVQVFPARGLLLHSGSASRSRCKSLAVRVPWQSARRCLTQKAGPSQPQPADNVNERPIVVLGGGIAGLTTTLSLARAMPPNRKIVLLESQSTLGGWVNSDRVQMAGRKNLYGTALIEAGPRSLRPKGVAGWCMLQLAISLGLQDRMIIVPSSAPSAKNRFIWFQGRLNKLPSSLFGFFSAIFRLPVLRSLVTPGCILDLLKEPFRKSYFPKTKRQSSRQALKDESIETFMHRRFGTTLGRRLTTNVLSAVLHGIYAADTKQLSVRSTLPMLYNTEQKHGSLLRAMLPPKWNSRYRAPTPHQEKLARAEQQELALARDYVGQTAGEDLMKQLDTASVFSFKNGIGELITALVDDLRTRTNVSIQLDEGATSLSTRKGTDELRLTTTKGNTLTPSHVVSALPSSTLASLIGTGTKDSVKVKEEDPRNVSNILTYNPSATVTVVNVVLPASRSRSRKRTQTQARPMKVDEGFGFLIPRAEAEASTNPDGILGVVFDSDAIPGQDEYAHTKLTVMIGGPHYVDRKTPLPGEKKSRKVALHALEKYLKVRPSLTNHPHTLVRVKMQEDCIPTYLPGHFSRMRTLHDVLSSGEILHGKLSVAGASYVGVSLNDIVRHSMKLGQALAKERKSTASTATGLEHFAASD